jgi:hypothetical protein
VVVVVVVVERTTRKLAAQVICISDCSRQLEAWASLKLGSHQHHHHHHHHVWCELREP